MEMNFINLKVRSCYSFLGSTITIPDLINHATQRQHSVVSLVEDAHMHSGIKFYSLAKEVGIKPIFGLSLPVKDEKASYEWTLFAINLTGYRFLLHLASTVQLEDFVTFKQILEFSKDLVVCTDVNYLQSNTQAHFPNHYVGINETDDLNETTRHELSKVEVVYLNDVRMLDEGEVATYKVLQAIKNNCVISQVEAEKMTHFLSPKDVRSISDGDEILTRAMANTVKIAARCQVNLDLHLPLLPTFTVPTGDKSIDYLRALCYKGAERRYGKQLSETVRLRLEYELDVIGKMGFADYFLIVWDFVKFAKSKGILVGPGRGSAAGSLLSYVLGITGVDPIAFDLLFERFLNPQRLSLPDIDIDFQDDRRDEVISYVVKKYGTYRVCQIATFGTFGTRSAWRDVARVHGLKTEEINGVSKFLTSRDSLKGNLRGNRSLMNYLQSHPMLEKIYQLATEIEGLPRHVSTHAAGIIISPNDLRNFTALGKGNSDVNMSQYEAEDLEKVGLLKMDFLGLRNLTMIEEITKQIKTT